ncbi:hypothetical protein WJU23_07750 [Prosthecobacter sp. SYSU 5D2]|uniref:hypothetical protein n=1 Tax=Prosthecobacter sp. SYSU 5D2 TaxID=3134134 RepID=UPI0031FE72BC
MNAFFKDLGRTVLQRWKQADFSLEKFPEIARNALDEKPPAQHVKLADFMREFLLDDEQPFQTQSGFGQPEIIAYDHPRFYIQLLFWLDGTTDIHQHEFSGAFHVMAGSSIHAHYQFDPKHTITPHLQLGDVRMKKIELLETGSTVPIISGSKCIHSLFHLETPSVTVVVRTQNDPGTSPQFNFLPPHIALDPHLNDFLTMRRKQLLDVMEQSEDPAYAELVLAMIQELDFERGFYVLQHSMGHMADLGEWDTVLTAFETKHGLASASIAPTLEQCVHRDSIKNMRSRIADPEHRFFLALLMNVASKSDVLTLVGQRFPEVKPVETLLRWAEELTDVSEDGTSILDATFPEVLETPAEEQPEIFLTSLRYFLLAPKKAPAILKSLSADDLDELRKSFAFSSLRVLVS